MMGSRRSYAKGPTLSIDAQEVLGEIHDFGQISPCHATEAPKLAKAARAGSHTVRRATRRSSSAAAVHELGGGGG